MMPIRTAIFGTGFMGRVHLEALRRVEHVEPAAITGRNTAAAEKLGAAFGVPYAAPEAILADASIHAIHICTPNALHFGMAKQALLAGKHVLCEKPLATSPTEAQELATLAAQKHLRVAVCHNLRYYPMVQQMRAMREAGDLGDILVVQGSYLQDWLLYDTDWNWRVDSMQGGPSRCMADVGSHWFDAAEHITGLRVFSLCADLQTFHYVRRQPKQSVETFANKTLNADDYIPTPVDTEDFGAVVFRMGTRARGAMTASVPPDARTASASKSMELNPALPGARSALMSSGSATGIRPIRSSSRIPHCSTSPRDSSPICPVGTVKATTTPSSSSSAVFILPSPTPKSRRNIPLSPTDSANSTSSKQFLKAAVPAPGSRCLPSSSYSERKPVC